MRGRDLPIEGGILRRRIAAPKTRRRNVRTRVKFSWAGSLRNRNQAKATFIPSTARAADEMALVMPKFPLILFIPYRIPFFRLGRICLRRSSSFIRIWWRKGKRPKSYLSKPTALGESLSDTGSMIKEFE